MALGITYRGADVFAPTDENGNVRAPSNQEAQVWSTEVERLISALTLSTNAKAVKGTLAELNAVVGSFANGDIGLVVTDATLANRGVYKRVSGVWVKQSDLPQDLSEAASNAAQAARDMAMTARNAAQAAQASSEGARNAAQQYASDAATVSGVHVPIYASVASASGSTIPADIKALQTQFFAPVYTDPSTLTGGGRYRRVPLEPSHSNKFRSTDRFLPDGSTSASNGGWWEKDPDQLYLTKRNISRGYEPVYDMDGSYGPGNSLSAQYIFDIGDITIPSGADKQHNVFRFSGIVRNNDAFETAGGKAIAFDLQGYNADLYGIIGTVTAKSGDKEVKAIYGRGVLDTADNGVAVGLVGGVTVTSAADGAQGTAWALQLTMDGPGNLSGASVNLTRLISLGTNEAAKTVGYGIFADQKLGYSTAFARAFNSGVGRFLQWDNYNGGSPINLFEVEKGGRVRSIRGTVGAPSFSFTTSADNNTGIYSPAEDQVGVATGGKEAMTFRVPPGNTFTSMIVLLNLAGVESARAVRVGAANSGPGGTGRALYVDNDAPAP